MLSILTLFFVKIALAFPYKFYNQLVHLCKKKKKPSGMFDGDCINSIDKFRENCYINNIVSSHPWTYVSPIIWILFFSAMFAVLRVKLLLFFLNLFSSNSFWCYTMVNAIVLIISFSNCLHLAYRNTNDFCILILCPVTLSNLYTSSSSFFCGFFRVFYIQNHVVRGWEQFASSFLT